MGKPDLAVPPPAKAPLIVKVVDGFNKPIQGAQVEVDTFTSKRTLPTTDQGIADFGQLNARKRVSITVSKPSFGPPANPFKPGNATVSRFPSSRPIVVPLTKNIAMLRVQTVTPAPDGKPIEGAAATVGGTKLPPTNPQGRSDLVPVPAGVSIACTSKKDGFKDGSGSQTLNDGEIFTLLLEMVQLPFVAPSIVAAHQAIVVMKKSFTKPKRLEITLSIDVDFDGKGTVTINRTGDGDLKAFDKQIDDATGKEVALSGSGTDFTGAQLKTGVKLFLEASATSSKLDDTEIVLTLSGGNKAKRDPAKLKVSVADLTLDVCKSRTTSDRSVDPVPLSVDDKTTAGKTKGRSVHRQSSNKHGRAMLIVRKPKPDKLPVTLTLTLISSGSSGTLKLLDVENAAPGDVAHGSPHEFPAPATDTKFFAEGDRKSGAMCDTGYRLGIKGIEDEVDLALLTVVEFTDLKVTVPVTLQKHLQAGNGIAPPSQDFTVTGTNNNDFEEDFTLGNTLVMLENSVSALDTIELSVKVAPSDVPVLWSVRRDEGTTGDSPEILKLKPTPSDRPSLKQQANPLEAQLTCDSVGSFHLCAFVDCNSNGQQDFNDPKTGSRIDREPFIILPLILVRVQCFQNTSVANQGNIKMLPAGATSATGVAIRTGAGIVGGVLAPTAQQAINFNAVATLIGGGRDGRLGLDRVFGGWINNLTSGTSVVAEYTAPPIAGSPAAKHFVTDTFASNNPSATPGAGTFVPGGTVVGPNFSSATPVVMDFPLLDTSPFPAGEGIGGITASGTDGGGPPGSKLPVKPPTNLPTALHPLPIGQDRQIEMLDTPSNFADASHPVFPGTLSSFHYQLNFRCELCFWTNMRSLRGAPASPAPAPPALRDLACMLYVSVQSVPWRINVLVDFDPAAGTATMSVKTLALTPDPHPDGAKRLAIPLFNLDHEVRFPTVLRTACKDATK